MGTILALQAKTIEVEEKIANGDERVSRKGEKLKTLMEKISSHPIFNKRSYQPPPPKPEENTPEKIDQDKNAIVI